MQIQSPDCGIPHTAAASTANTANNKADGDTPSELVANTLANAKSCSAHTDAEETAAARETADTPQAQTATAIAADGKIVRDKPDKPDVISLAKAS